MFKKLFAIACIAVAVWACTDTNDVSLVTPEVDDAQQETLLTGTRTEAEARACAIDAFARFYGASRSLTLIKDVKCVTSKSESRSEGSDTLYYVVNTEGDAGYAVIAADRAHTPVLAVTECGNIEDVENVENPGAEIFFDALSDYHAIREDLEKIDSMSIIKPIYPVDRFNEYRTVTSSSERIAGPYAPFAWGQGFPENYHFPNQIAGCGNIASLLIMSHFEEPKTYNANNRLINVDWSVIKQHSKSSGFYSDECGLGLSARPHKALADLCWAVAERNKSMYEAQGTATTISNVNEMFKDCVPNLYVGDVRDGFPGTLPDNSDMMYYVRATADPEGGHAFVIDGKLTVTCSTTTAVRVKGTDFWNVVSSESVTILYSHINWGWNGHDNGYFYDQPFKVSEGYRYDDEHYDGGPKFLTNYRYFAVGAR
ncbi:MAG: C10 family peptidase [Muribaculaceae bacterium]|nr:C10 family peptidase [Muribaculaceae bacterium]MDE6487135.1 C10 family peptidase [Muribaculaceae bacterium]